ncbi:MAG: hypothetical protein ACREGF_02440 [Candidatus Saccharimonadales bacterium]
MLIIAGMIQTAEELVDLKPVNPGSYNDFCLAHPELSDGHRRRDYENELDGYRDRLASYYGVSREELHEGTFAALGECATGKVEVQI